MQHNMQFLNVIAHDDVCQLEIKERIYKGSWKKRGGVGAAMMLLRKVDRLENMLQEAEYDIFKVIGHEVSGADGTALAEVRDLRRYLMLVESEVMARHPEEFPRPGTPADGGHYSAADNDPA